MLDTFRTVSPLLVIGTKVANINTSFLDVLGKILNYNLFITIIICDIKVFLFQTSCNNIDPND